MNNAPFLTVYSCKFGNRLQDAIFGPPINLLILREPLVLAFAWGLVLAFWYLLYYIWPISTAVNSYDGVTKSSIKAFYFALLFYFVVSFFFISAVHTGGCRAALSQLAVDEKLAVMYGRLLQALEIEPK